MAESGGPDVASIGLYGILIVVSLAQLAGAVVSAVTIRRNSRAGVLALAGCVALLISNPVYFLPELGFSYIVAQVLGGLVGLVGFALLLLAALLPRPDAAAPRSTYPAPAYGNPAPIPYQQQPPPHPDVATHPGGQPGMSVADELGKLGALVEQGLLTPEEFQTRKAHLLTSR